MLLDFYHFQQGNFEVHKIAVKFSMFKVMKIQLIQQFNTLPSISVSEGLFNPYKRFQFDVTVEIKLVITDGNEPVTDLQ